MVTVPTLREHHGGVRVFLVRVDRIFFRWHPERPFYVLRLNILEPREHQGRSLNGRLCCTPKALWKLRWFLRDFGYDPDLMGRDEVDEKALMGLRGIVRISRTTLNGRSFLNLGAVCAQPVNGKNSLCLRRAAREVARDV